MRSLYTGNPAALEYLRMIASTLPCSVRMSRGFCNDLPVFRVTRRCFQLPLHLCRLIPGIDFPLEFNIFRVARFERGKLLF